MKWVSAGPPSYRRRCAKWKTGSPKQISRARSYHKRRQERDFARWAIDENFRTQREYEQKYGIQYPID